MKSKANYKDLLYRERASIVRGQNLTAIFKPCPTTRTCDQSEPSSLSALVFPLIFMRESLVSLGYILYCCIFISDVRLCSMYHETSISDSHLLRSCGKNIVTWLAAVSQDIARGILNCNHFASLDVRTDTD